jgi:cytoskeletal protein CcmA (bactofilin family)
MFKRKEKEGIGPIDTLVGKNASVQGDISFFGGLHIDGRIIGSVKAPADADASLSVSEDGVIEGSVVARNVVLNGRVNGDIIATDRVILGAKARVNGDVHYGVIEMAHGAEISGRLVPRSGVAVVPK